jgi:hypothetical protein
MTSLLNELVAARDRAARELMAIEGWRCSGASVAWAIEAMLANSERSKPAQTWLWMQIRDLPPATDADLRLNDLTLAIEAIAAADRAEAESMRASGR